EVAAQTSIFITARQDTTANTMAFAIRELAKDPDFQKKLRAEIYSSIDSSGAPSGTGYDNMPLLNAFIKETLRLYPITPLPEKFATQDTILPLSQDIQTTSGEKISGIPIRKGQLVMLGLASYQRLESLWGSDAAEFKPSRWIDGTTYKGTVLGPYANLLSFLGGPHTCLG
ncbi:cytochrome P450, partial [Mycena rebaudengoi]